MTLAFVFLTAQISFAATYTVTKIADTNDGVCDSDCSLREAIGAAVATPDDDIIVFDQNVFNTAQTITLSGTDILITSNGTLTINGPGASLLTINGNNQSRIFTNSTAAVTVISGLTLTGGNGVSATATGRAGAVYNNGGNLTLNQVTITGNSAANGGGTNNAGNGVLTINRSVLSNNTASGSGGAMQNFSGSTLNINNTTIMGNTSNGTTGGGAGQLNGTSYITNSTIANNTAPSAGGFQSNGILLVITNSTISGNTSTNNGGGLHRATTNVNGYIRNSIISGNNGTSASPDVTNSTGGITSEGNNIIGNVGTSTGWVAADLLNINPMLNPLADNGGFNMTFLPMAGSPAIDAGQNCVIDQSCTSNNPTIPVTTDQRGIIRPQGTTVDIGSVEVALTPSNATVSGRVSAPGGVARSRVVVTLSNANGVVSTALTNSFGYFTFFEVATGQTYSLSAESKQYNFTPQNITVNGDISGLTLTATSENLHR